MYSWASFRIRYNNAGTSDSICCLIRFVVSLSLRLGKPSGDIGLGLELGVVVIFLIKLLIATKRERSKYEWLTLSEYDCCDGRVVESVRQSTLNKEEIRLVRAAGLRSPDHNLLFCFHKYIFYYVKAWPKILIIRWTFNMGATNITTGTNEFQE